MDFKLQKDLYGKMCELLGKLPWKDVSEVLYPIRESAIQSKGGVIAFSIKDDHINFVSGVISQFEFNVADPIIASLSLQEKEKQKEIEKKFQDAEGGDGMEKADGEIDECVDGETPTEKELIKG